jgi:hypothetical protein
MRGTYYFDKTGFFIGTENRQWGGRTFLGVQIFENMLLPVKQTFMEYYHVRGNLLFVCRATLLLFLWGIDEWVVNF